MNTNLRESLNNTKELLYKKIKELNELSLKEEEHIKHISDLTIEIDSLKAQINNLESLNKIFNDEK